MTPTDTRVASMDREIANLRAQLARTERLLALAEEARTALVLREQGWLSTRNIEEDAQTIAQEVLCALRVWCLAADWGIDYCPDGEHRGYTSAEEILSTLGATPENVGCTDDDWPPEPLRTYAQDVWTQVPRVLYRIGQGGPR